MRSNPQVLNRPPVSSMIRMYVTVLFIMMMLFGILLLPSTHVVSYENGLVEEVFEDRKTSTYTPFVNNEFTFYWSPIDPLYDQADTEQNCPWGIDNNHNEDDNNGQTDDEERRGISFYGDSWISDEGAIAIGSYDDDNEITVKIMKGHIFTQQFKDEYPENTLHGWWGGVYRADGNPDEDRDGLVNEDPVDDDGDGYNNEDPADGIDNDGDGLIDEDTGGIEDDNDGDWYDANGNGYYDSGDSGVDEDSIYDDNDDQNGRADREDQNLDRSKWRIDLYDPARRPLNCPDLEWVEDYELWSGTLDQYEGEIFYTTKDWWLWDGTLKVESSGRITVQKLTVTDGYIDKNGNGIPDLHDDVDPDDNNGDYEVAHGVNTEWFANGMSDDAIWSFYGDEFFGFVHRDLMIASYDDDNHIEIIDIDDDGDSDDSREFTLDVWENYQWVSTFVEDTWCGGDDAGDNNELDYNRYFDIDWYNTSEAQEAMNSDLIDRAVDSGNFEADWVVVKSDKPVTLYGGIWDNNFHTQAYGFLGSRYYVPMSTAITITGLEREAHVELNFDDTSEGDDEFTIYPGEQVTIKNMMARPFSNNYVAEVAWVRIISDWPIRVEIWMANDDNAFDETQISTFKEGFDYYPADEKWDLAIHHRCLVYIIALEDDTSVGWDGTWLDNQPSGATLDKYEIYRIVVDSNEDYNGDEADDTEPDNQDELESVIQMIHVNADKDVMLEVRYARDFSCEPQDMDIVLSTNPTFQRVTTGDSFWTLPLILSILLGIDIYVVAAGGNGIVGTLNFTGKGKFFKTLKNSLKEVREDRV